MDRERDAIEAGGLRDDLIRWIDAPEEGGFDSLALRVLRFQARANPVYSALLRARGIEATSLDRWDAFPPLPTRAFREFQVYSGEPGSEEAHFMTSGTTSAVGSRGTHRVGDLELYRTSLLRQAERYLRPELEEGWGAERSGLGPGPGAGASSDSAPPMRVLALLPSPTERPDSSLVYMAGTFLDHWDDGGGGFFASPEWELDLPGFRAALSDASRDGVPVLLVGTAFAWVHWLDRTGGDRPELAPGSRLMETGGFKGRSRRVPREELYLGLSEALGLPVGRIVNEYGMTELLSQFYEPVLRARGTVREADDADTEGDDADRGDGDAGIEPSTAPWSPGGSLRYHEGPPWVRTRVLDPVTLDPVGEGEPGLLCHLDLANLFSAAHVLTEDLGVRVSGEAGDRPAFRLLGRSPGAEPRGCSLVMEELWGEADG